jgi:hypothetical protein
MLMRPRLHLTSASYAIQVATFPGSTAPRILVTTTGTRGAGRA